MKSKIVEISMITADILSKFPRVDVKGEVMTEFENDKCQYIAERQALRVLELFDAVPYFLLEEFLVNKNPEEDFDPQAVVNYLLRERMVCYNPKNKCYSLARNIKKDFSKVAALAVYNEFAKDRAEKVAKARYPFDYVFEDLNRIMVLIDYSKDGPYKLNFMNQMDLSCDEKYRLVPIIMLINSSIDVLKERNENGRLYLLPKEDFYVAEVLYKTREKGSDIIGISKQQYQGGTLDKAIRHKDRFKDLQEGFVF